MGGPIIETSAPWVDHDQLGPERLCRPSYPQVESAVLFFEVRTPQQDRLGRLQVVDPATSGECRQELWIEAVIQLGVEMIRSDGDAHELRERIGVLVRTARPAERRHCTPTISVDDGSEAVGNEIQGVAP